MRLIFGFQVFSDQILFRKMISITALLLLLDTHTLKLFLVSHLEAIFTLLSNQELKVLIFFIFSSVNKHLDIYLRSYYREVILFWYQNRFFHSIGFNSKSPLKQSCQ